MLKEIPLTHFRGKIYPPMSLSAVHNQVSYPLATPSFFFFVDISAQERGGGLELVTSALLGMIPPN